MTTKLANLAYSARFILIMLDDHSEKGNLLKMPRKLSRHIRSMKLMKVRKSWYEAPIFHSKIFQMKNRGKFY